MKYIVFAILILSVAALAVEFSTTARVSVTPVFNLSMDIKTQDIIAGDNITLDVNLQSKNLTNIAKEIGVTLDYEILKGKKSIKNGTFFVNVTQETNTSFNIPSEDMRGKNTIKVTASHPQAISSQDGDDFFIKGSVKMASIFSFFDIFNWI